MLQLAMWLFVTSVSTLLTLTQAGSNGHGHHHVIIHVPYPVKTIHHTHTITKHIHHKDDGDKSGDLGYSNGHFIDVGGHRNGHSEGGSISDHEFDVQQYYNGIHWPENVQGQDIEGGNNEGSSDGGTISSHEFDQIGYPGHEKHGVWNHGYRSLESFPSH